MSSRRDFKGSLREGAPAERVEEPAAVGVAKSHRRCGFDIRVLPPFCGVGHRSACAGSLRAYGGGVVGGGHAGFLQEGAAQVAVIVVAEGGGQLGQREQVSPRRVLTNTPAAFDPRDYLKVAREEVKKMVRHKIVNVLGSSNTL